MIATGSSKVSSSRVRLTVAQAVTCQVHFCGFPLKKVGDVQLDPNIALTPSGEKRQEGQELTAFLATRTELLRLVEQLESSGNRFLLAKRFHNPQNPDPTQYFLEGWLQPAYEGPSLAEVSMQVLRELLAQEGMRDYCVTGFLNQKDHGDELLLHVWKAAPTWIRREYPDGLKVGVLAAIANGFTYRLGF